jgi:hypothetical protein
MTDDQWPAELGERLRSCPATSVAAVAEAFADIGQDDVTGAVAALIAERTHLERLPRLPYRVGLTMYGDDGVSEW